jgi:cytochrome P450
LVGGQPVTDHDLGKLANMIVAGSVDTTVTTMSNVIAWLAEHPTDRTLLLDDPNLIPGAVEEVLRYEHLLLNGRLVVSDVEIDGHQLKAGDRVMLLLPATGRDPEVFDRPDEMDFRRSPNPHLGFGQGPHLCIGIHFARSVLRIAITRWLAAFPTFALDDGAHPVRKRGYVTGVRQLRLRLR